jgi:uncharacterized SAM-binding protein YcdF (DUF218 family)
MSSKLLPLFLYPLGLVIWLILIGGLFAAFKFRRFAASMVATALVVLWISSTPVLAQWALASLERQYPARTIAETPEADVAIVLGGAIGQPVPPRVEAHLSGASDRVLHAARLYRAGKVKRILVSAGNLPWVPAVNPEAQLIRELLVEWGVPAEAIDTAGASRNTYENALEIRDIWRKTNFSSGLLVTSAAHMPRAMAVFRHAGLPVVASTTDVRVAGEFPGLLAWLPDASSLVMTTEAAKEWLGYWVYWALGRL